MFPVLVGSSEGSISAALRGGAGHLGLAGRIDLVRSLDGGLTWTPPAVIADSQGDDRNPAYGVTTSGVHVLAYQVQSSYSDDGQYTPDINRTAIKMTRSHDNGLTWEPATIVDTAGLGGSPCGRIVCLGNGSLLMAVYSTRGGEGYPGGSYVMRSLDQGMTWEPPTLIAEGRDETSLLVLPDGGLLAALRMTGRDQSLALCRSGDDGRTWSAPEEITSPMQHPADLILLRNDTVLLTYGNRQSPHRIEGRISLDGGQTWRDELLMFSGQLYGYDLPEKRQTDMGYPSNALIEGGSRVATIYYVHPFSQMQDRTWSGPSTTPFYLATGYRAISITWSVDQLLSALDTGT